MRFGLSIGIGKPTAPQQLVQRIGELEAVGLDACWMGQLFGVDTLTLYALAGSQTETIELGTAVIPIYARHPLVLASQALTTQAVTGNRLVLGLGSSHAALIRDTMGLEYARPAAYLREYLTVLRPALDGEAVEHRGELLRVTTGALGRTGVSGACRVPVVVGTFSPHSLRVAGELADGVMTWLAGPNVIREQVVPAVADAAAEAGRPPPRVVVGLPIAVTDDVEGERAVVERTLGAVRALPGVSRCLRSRGDHGSGSHRAHRYRIRGGGPARGAG
jgi:F420-dependent oxidoreductase-like protein